MLAIISSPLPTGSAGFCRPRLQITRVLLPKPTRRRDRGISCLHFSFSKFSYRCVMIVTFFDWNVLAYKKYDVWEGFGHYLSKKLSYLNINTLNLVDSGSFPVPNFGKEKSS